MSAALAPRSPAFVVPAGVQRLASIAAVALALVGCVGARQGRAAPRGVEAAALPYRLLAARGGAEVPEAEVLATLGTARAVCIGEHHPSPHDHWAQLHLFEALVARNRAAGTETALGMEMVQRPFQGVLDDFGAGRIDQPALVSRTGWKDRWGYDFALYRPVILRAVRAGATLVALNAARELTKKISKAGRDGLSEVERAELPELVLDDPDHRAWWNAIMADMGGATDHSVKERSSAEAGDEAAPASAAAAASDPAQHAAAAASDPAQHAAAAAVPDPAQPAAAASPPAAGPSGRAERVYTAQVLWDETMADTAARWLAGGTRRQIVILAGSGHCHESAIVRRLERRGVGDVMSVRPLIDKGDGELSDLLARPENDFLFVMSRE